jgi:TPR repeat protein
MLKRRNSLAFASAVFIFWDAALRRDHPLRAARPEGLFVKRALAMNQPFRRLATFGGAFLLAGISLVSLAPALASDGEPPSPAPDAAVLAAEAPPPADADGQALLLEATRAYGGVGRDMNRDEARGLFDQAAATGDPIARVWKARLMYYGWCRYKREPAAARELALGSVPEILRRAEAGDPAAMFLMGFIAEEGVGVEKSLEDAAAWHIKSAKAGEVFAMSNIAYLLWRGQGIPENKREAIRWYEIAINNHDSVMAMMQLAVALTDDDFKPRADDIARGVELNQRAAQRGAVGALVNLADLMMEGKGLPKDEAGAAALYLQAAEMDYPRAMRSYAKALLSGSGVERNPEAALEWYRRAADRGDDASMNNLGIIYTEGIEADGAFIVKKDLAEAVKWFRKAAEYDNAAAMYNLTPLLWKGEGAPSNRREALDLRLRAAKAGVPEAMNAAGLMYFKGVGVAKDDAQAAIWFQKAVDEGDPLAMNNLGALYEDGVGVDQNTEKAIALYRRALRVAPQKAKSEPRQAKDFKEAEDKARENLRRLGAL